MGKYYIFHDCVDAFWKARQGCEEDSYPMDVSYLTSKGDGKEHFERILTELQRSRRRNLDHEGATTARFGTETTEHGQGRQEEVFSLWTKRTHVSRVPDRTSVL